MIFLYQILDNCQVTSMGLKGPPELQKGGGLKVSAGDILTVQAQVYVEALGEDGEVIDAGKWFNVVSVKDQVIRFRQMTSGKTYTDAEIKKKRKAATVVAVEQEDSRSAPFAFDAPLGKVIASLAKIRDGIPEEYRVSAHCEIRSESGYEGGHSAEIRVTYERPETDGEVIARLEDKAIEAMINERSERAKFEKLKKKFA